VASKLQADEISSIIKERIENFEVDIDISEVGKVASVSDGVAKIYGLNNVMAGEMIERSASEASPVHGPASPTRVVYDRSVELVMSSAQEYFNSSANLMDSCMDLARYFFIIVTVTI